VASAGYDLSTWQLFVTPARRLRRGDFFGAGSPVSAWGRWAIPYVRRRDARATFDAFPRPSGALLLLWDRFPLYGDSL